MGYFSCFRLFLLRQCPLGQFSMAEVFESGDEDVLSGAAGVEQTRTTSLAPLPES